MAMAMATATANTKNLKVHLTRLTVEDVDRIRRQIKQEAENKSNKGATVKKKRKISLYSKSSENDANCTVEDLKKDLILINQHSQKLEKINKRKKYTAFSVSKKRKKRNLDTLSPKLTSKNSFIAYPPTSDFSPQAASQMKSKRKTCRYKSDKWIIDDTYSTSEESELEAVLVPSKIYIKPSARPMPPSSSKVVTTDCLQTCENSQSIKCNSTATFGIRQPVVLISRMNSELNVKRDTSDFETKIINASQIRNVPNMCYCQQRRQSFQRFSHDVCALPNSHKTVLETLEQEEQTESKESTNDNEEHFQHPVTTSTVLENIFSPRSNLSNEIEPHNSTALVVNAVLSEKSGNSETSEHSLTQCSEQSTVISTEEEIPSVMPTEKASSKNTVTTFENDSLAKRNESDTTVLSPVIFDEEPQAICSDVSSPVIFGSNEGSVQSCDTVNASKQQSQGVTNDIGNSTSTFVLELSTGEHFENESKSQNCNRELTFDASENFNLQLSKDISQQNVQSINFQEFSASNNFLLEVSGESLTDDVSDINRYSQQFSTSKNALLLESQNNNPSEAEITNHLPAIDTESNSESEKSNSFALTPNLSESQNCNLSTESEVSNFSEGNQVYLSVPKDKSLSRSNKVFLSVVKPTNVTKSQKVIMCSVKNPSPTALEKFLSSTKVLNLPERNKSNLVAIEELKTMENQQSTLKSVKLSDAFTQTELREIRQQHSQVNVSCIINGPGVDTIRFEGRVLNHPSTMVDSDEKILASDSTFAVEDNQKRHGVFTVDQISNIPSNCNVNFFHRNEVSQLPKSDCALGKSSATSNSATKLPFDCSDSTLNCTSYSNQPCTHERNLQFLASKNTLDFIDLTGDELKPAETPLGKIRLKTPSELGCTIAFTEDMERLFRHELPPLHCDLEKLDLLKKKHFSIFRMVLSKCFLGMTVNDTLLELYRTRSVPCGFNLLKNCPQESTSAQQTTASTLRNSVHLK